MNARWQPERRQRIPAPQDSSEVQPFLAPSHRPALQDCPLAQSKSVRHSVQPASQAARAKRSARTRTSILPAVKAMVLAAGLGTRLEPLTHVVAKPLVPVLGIPLLRYTLSLLAGAGVREAVVNGHAHAAQIEAALREQADLGLALTFSHEPALLGTGGGLKNVERFFSGEEAFLLVNGDVLFDCDLRAAVAAHRAAGAAATMVLAPWPEGAGYAAVECDAHMRVLRVAGRGAPGEARKYHFTGVHVLGPRVLEALPAGVSDINRTAYGSLLETGARVHGHLDTGSWSDLGSPARYLATNLEVLAGRTPLDRFGAFSDPFLDLEARPGRVFVDPAAHVEDGAELRGPCLVAAGARVRSGAEVGPGACVGRNAEIGPGASVEHSVVWAGTQVRAGEVLEWQVAAGDLRVAAG